jgi:signal transduction histidine kinase
MQVIITDHDVLKFMSDLVASARRVQAMYSGLQYFFKFERLDRELFLPVEFYGLCSKVAKAVRLSNSLKETIPVQGEGEAECIENQMNLVIQNLLQNAIKFTQHLQRPEVRVSVGTQSYASIKRRYEHLSVYDARGEWLELHVEDNGPGIEPAVLPNIFNLYYTKPPHGTNQHGTGMGLAISRLVMTIHGGVLFVNTKSRWTDFVVLLPLQHAHGIDLRLLVKEELSL